MCVAILGVLVAQGQAQDEIRKLIRQLGDDDQQVRQEASRKLTGLGEDAVPLVEKAREDKDAEVASRARQILDSIYRPLLELPEKSRAKLKEVEARIASLRNAGSLKDAEALEAAFRHTRRQILSNKPALADGPEVHVVGLYGARKGGGLVRVRVTSKDRPVILVVCSYDRTAWGVEAETGVELQKVIVGGYHVQEVKDLPKDVPLLKKVYEEGATQDYFFAYKREDETFAEMARKVRKLTGKSVATFQGSYYPPSDAFLVGPENSSWRNERLAPLVNRLHEEATREAREALAAEMRKLRFTAVHLSVDRFELRSGPFGEFTPFGPIAKTLQPVKGEGARGLMAVAIDPSGKTYGLTMHKVVEIDAVSADLKVISPKAERGDKGISWPQAATFDTKRRRLLVTDAAGADGHLWAYDPAKGTWSVLAKMSRPHITGLAYGAGEDVLYGLGQDRRTPGFFSELYRFNADGALLDTVRLREPIRAGKEGRESAQVISLDKDRLVVLVGPLLNPEEGPEYVNQTTVINPKTGEPIFSCVQKVE